MKIILLTLALVTASFIHLNLNAQLAGGTYTIGPTGNYATFNAAVAAMSSGISGPVVFNVQPGTYNEQVEIGEIQGASAANTIIFNGNGATLSYSGGSSNRFVIHLNGADYVTLQNLTVKTLNNIYGWGVFLSHSADNNSIINCTIDISSVSHTNAHFSAGILTSNNSTFVQSGADADANFNYVSGCTIFGSPTGPGMYQGILVNGTGADAGSESWTIENNTIQDFHYYGIRIYFSGGNHTIISNNIHRENKTDADKFYGIEINRAGSGNTIKKNFIHDPFTNVSTISSTYDAIGINLYQNIVSSSNPSFVVNNIINLNRGVDEGDNYGIHVQYQNNYTYFYHNTVSIQMESTGSGSVYEQYGMRIFIFSTGYFSDSEVKNNIFHMNVTSPGSKYHMYAYGNSIYHGDYDFNNYFFDNGMSDHNIGYFDNENRESLADWQTVFGSNSLNVNPLFSDLLNGNLSPSNALLDEAGIDLFTSGIVTDDFNSIARTSTPDLGALEFTPPSDDAGITSIDEPNFSAIPGIQDIRLSLTNYGSNTLTSADLKWKIDGGAINSYGWTSPGLTSGASANNILVGTHNFSAGSSTISSWLENPNGQPGAVGVTDTLTETVFFCNPLSGNYTIGGAGADYPDINSAAFDLKYCGVNGPVVFNLNPGATFNEQVILSEIPGASTTNSITFEGNNATIEANTPHSSNSYIIYLDGADHITLQNLVIKTLATNIGIGVLLSNDASYNTIQNCTLDISSVNNNSTLAAGIFCTNSLTWSYGPKSEASHINISNCLIKGNPVNAGMRYAIMIFGTGQNSGSSNWTITNNVIQDFYSYGIGIRYSGGGHTVRNNEIHRSNKTTCDDFHGLYMEYAGGGNTIDRNYIHSPFDGILSVNSGNDAYGIRANRCDGSNSEPNLFTNNIIDFNRGADEGDNYGLYFEYSNNHWYILNNTVSIIMNTTGSANSFDQSCYHSKSNFVSPYMSDGLVKNNLFYLKGTAPGNKYLVFLDRQLSYQPEFDYNSLFIGSGTTDAHIGHLQGTDLTTFADWQVNYGAHSVNSNPLFLDELNGDFTPQSYNLNASGYDYFTSGLVVEDFYGVARTSFIDMGAIEFTPSNVDASVVSLDHPVISTTPGLHEVRFGIKNMGLSALLSADIKWDIDNTGPYTFPWVSPGLGAGGAENDIIVGNYNFAVGTSQIKAWIENPNGLAGGPASSDTLFDSVYICSPLAGTYTIGGAGADYNNFSEVTADLLYCGVSGPVIFNINPSVVYNEQLVIPEIQGASAANTITFNGNGAEITYSSSDISNKEIIYLNGADYITLDSLLITSSGPYAWAIRLGNKAEYNVIRNCSIDFSAMNGSSGYVAAIVSTHSNTSTENSGTGAEANYNTITNNRIIGGANAYMEGISLTGSNVSSITYGNSITDNVLMDFYRDGIRLYYTGSSNIVRANNIGRPNIIRSHSSSRVISLHYTEEANIIEGNYIHHPYGNMTPSNYSFTAIDVYFPTSNAANATVIKNNIVKLEYDGNVTLYGIKLDRSPYTHLLHNTVLINSNSTKSQYGFYLYAQTNFSLEYSSIKNNIVYMDVQGSVKNYAIYLYGTSSFYDAHGDYNHNNYYIIPGSSFNKTAYWQGNDYATLTDWQAAKSGYFDQNSTDVNPTFRNPVAGDFSPESPALDGTGFDVLSHVPLDYFGVARTNPPDIGAIEFTSLLVNATARSIDSPTDPDLPGMIDVRISVENLGQINLTSVRIWWQIDANPPSSYLWGGTVTPGDTLHAQLVGSYNFPIGQTTIKAWLSDPNGFTGGSAVDDTITKVINICHPLNGAYQIGGVGGDFPNFTSAFDQISSCGMSGPVVFNVFTDTYNETVEIPEISGLSATNTLTVHGNGASLTFNNSSTSPYLMYLNGADYVTIDSLNFVTQDDVYGWGIRLGYGADHNIIKNCTFDFTSIDNSSSSSYLYSCGVVSTNSDVDGDEFGVGANANYNTITHNTFLGSPTGQSMNSAVSISGIQEDSGSIANVITDNVFRNGRFYSIQLLRTAGHHIIRNNEFLRPENDGSGGLFGIYLFQSAKGNLIEKNLFHHAYDGDPANTYTASIISLSACVGSNAEANIIRNNIIHIDNGAGGLRVFSLSRSDYTKIYHNTVYISRNSNETQRIFEVRGGTGANSLQHAEIKNNLVYMNVIGAAEKHMVYISDNRDDFDHGDYNHNAYYFASGMTNAHVGYFYNANFTTLAQWKTARNSSFDQNSIYTNTQLIDPSNGDYSPSNSALNNAAFDLFTPGSVTDDFYGIARTATPDFGAVEFAPPSDDAGISSIDAPSVSAPPGVTPIRVTLTNYGSTVLNSATLKYEITGGVTGSFSWTGTVNPTASQGNITIGSPVINSGVYDIKAWSETPNGNPDVVNNNDTAYSTFWVCSPLNGTYTIGGAGADFLSVTNAVDHLTYCGISGPVVFNINPGVYTEQIEIPQISGANATNTIIFNGNGATIQYLTTAAENHIIYLNGADYVTLDNLTIKAMANSSTLAIRLGNGANRNKITNSTLDLRAITSSGSESWGIFSSHEHNDLTAGAGADANYNVISNNIIMGPENNSTSLTGGIGLAGTSTATGSSNNVISGNTITNFDRFGIQILNSSGNNTISNNEISRPTTTNCSSFEGINLHRGGSGNLIEKNHLHDPFKNYAVSISGSYGIYLFQCFGTAGSPNVVRNNLIVLNNGQGASTGLSINRGGYNFVYHNTIYSTFNSNNEQIGFLLEGFLYDNPNMTTNRIKNNIVYLGGSGSGMRYVFFVDGHTSSSTYDVNGDYNYNNYFISSSLANSVFAHHLGTDFNTLADWQTFKGGIFDQNSFFTDPYFRNPAAGDFTPGSLIIDNQGINLLTVVPVDYSGTPRTTTPDMGILEFDAPNVDAGISALDSPPIPSSPGTMDLKVTLHNFGLDALTDVEIYWQINGGPVSQYNWSHAGTGLTTGTSETDITLGNYFFGAGTYNLRVWTEKPNGVQDINTGNDELNIVLDICNPMSGTYDIGGLSADFQSISEAVHRLVSCGVNAPVVLNINNSIVYEEHIEISVIPGANVINTVTFNGNGAVVRYNCSSSSPEVLLLKGVDYVTINNLTIQTLNNSIGWGVRFANGADYNIIYGCTIDVSSLERPFNTYLPGGIICVNGNDPALSGSASYNLIENNYIFTNSGDLGAYFGIYFKGNGVGIGSSNNSFVGNTISDFRAGGIYIQRTGGFQTVSDNTIERFDKTLGSNFTSIELDECGAGNTIERNLIHDLFKGNPTLSFEGKGIRVDRTVGNAGNPNIIRNNLIALNNGGGRLYGIELQESDYTYVLNNTVFLKSSSDYNSRGLYSYATSSFTNTHSRFNNNIVYVDMSGSATHHALFLNDFLYQGSFDYNNYYINVNHPTTYLGGTNTTNYASLTTWQSANGGAYDQNSLAYFPGFTDETNLDFTPTSIFLDNQGTDLFTSGLVTDDFNGAARTVTPDMGALEFIPKTSNAAMISIDPLGSNECPQDLIFNFGNAGTGVINDISFSYTIDGGPAVPVTPWSGILSQAQIISGYNAGTEPFSIGSHTLKVFITSVNGGNDEFNKDDTATLILNITDPLPSPPTASNASAEVSNPVPDLTAVGSDIKWYSDNPPTTLVGTGTSFASGQTAEGIYTYYVTQNIICESPPDSAILTIFDPGHIIWTGEEYVNGSGPGGAPDQTDGSKEFHIRGNEGHLSNDARVKSVMVYNDLEFTVDEDYTLSVINGIENYGTLIVENNSSLVQEDENNTNSGTGTYIIKRNGNNVTHMLQMWSSPVEGAALQGAGAIFEGSNPCVTLAWNASSQRWKYDYVLNYSTTCGGNLQTFSARHLLFDDPADNIMDVGRGYFVPGSPTHPNKEFVGEIHNGTILKPVYETFTTTPFTGDDWNLLGNPYPSALGIKAFLDTNNAKLSTLAVYLWDDDGSGGADYDEYDDYATVNALGFVGGQDGNGKFATAPLGIASGQGFFIEVNSNTQVKFSNSMRIVGNNEKFYKSTPDPVEKFNIALTSHLGVTKSALIGFKHDATLGKDRMYDAPVLNPSGRQIIGTMMGSIPQSIQAIPDLPNHSEVEIPLFIHVLEGGIYQLDVTPNEFVSDIDVYLKIPGQIAEIPLNGSATPLSLKNGENPGYKLVFRKGNVLSHNTINKLFGWELINTHDELVVELIGDMDVDTRIEVIDLKGIVHESLNITDQITRINTQNWAAGMYLVHLTSETRDEVKRVVVR